jgi:ATP phosphoribosyltransferase
MSASRGRTEIAEKRTEPKLTGLNYGGSRLCAAVRKIRRSSRSRSCEAAHRDAFHVAPTSKATAWTGERRARWNPVNLGIAGAVIDVVDTGSTLRQAGLRIIGAPLFVSNAALYAHPGREVGDEVLTLKNRIEGKLVAYEYMMVEYDAPADVLPEATRITPGIESPTISPLQAEGWYSVKARVRKREANRLMDELYRAGCKGILLTSIESARI